MKQQPAIQNGVTLIELIFVVCIIGIGAAFVTRMASAAVNAARSSNSVAQLYASLTRARSFAASAGVDVVLCPSTDGATCAPGYHWERGWIAFPAVHTGSNRKGDEPIIAQQKALPPNVHLITSTGRTRVRFQPSGGNAGSNVTFTICDGRGERSAAAYAMANNGSLRTIEPTADYAQLACEGT